MIMLMKSPSTGYFLGFLNHW